MYGYWPLVRFPRAHKSRDLSVFVRLRSHDWFILGKQKNYLYMDGQYLAIRRVVSDQVCDSWERDHND